MAFENIESFSERKHNALSIKNAFIEIEAPYLNIQPYCLVCINGKHLP